MKSPTTRSFLRLSSAASACAAAALLCILPACERGASQTGERRLLSAPPAPFAETGSGENSCAVRSDRFVFGSRAFVFGPDGELFLQTSRCKIPLVASVGVRDGSSMKWIRLAKGPNGCESFMFKAEGSNAFKLSGELPLSDGGRAAASLVATLEKDGSLRVVVSVVSPDGGRLGEFDPLFSIETPMREAENGRFLVKPDASASMEDVKISLSSTRRANGAKPSSSEAGFFVYYDAPYSAFSLKLDGRNEFLSLNPLAAQTLRVCQFKDRFQTVLHAPGKASLEFSLRVDGGSQVSSKPGVRTVAGVDFHCDNLALPDIGDSSNLMPNPSFEAGLRYRFLAPHYRKPNEVVPPLDIYSIDENGGRGGSRCLKVNAYPRDVFFNPETKKTIDISNKSTLDSFAIPVVPGELYTASVYARTDAASASLVFFSMNFGGSTVKVKNPVWHFPSSSLALGKEWKRFSFEFVPETGAASLRLSAVSDIPGAHVWIDDLQLEKGPLSDFKPSPLDAELLVNGSPKAFLDDSSPCALALSVRGSCPSTKGLARVEISDFSEAKLFSASVPFETDANGRAVLPLECGDAVSGSDLYLLRAEFELGAVRRSELFRLSRVPFLKNAHRNKNLFAIPFTPCYPDMPERLAAFQAFGVGAFVKQRPEKELFDLYKSFGIDVLSTELGRPFGRNAVGFYESSDFVILLDGKPVVSWPTSCESISPETAQAIEDGVCKVVERYPWLTWWCLFSEMHGFFKKLPEAERAKMYWAAWRGVKKANPSALALQEGGPANMSSDLGVRDVDRVLKASPKEPKFDAIGIHPYRERPESPDLDADMAELLSVMGVDGYGEVPVMWEEGNYFPFYCIPSYSLNCYNGAASADHWCLGALSYDIGWGERVSAAYSARYNLVALKYADRLKGSAMWNGAGAGWTFQDCLFSPFSWTQTCNSLGVLLGDAKYAGEVCFAPQTRAYLFIDKEERPVAAVWSFGFASDNGSKNSPSASLRLDGVEPEFFGLMGEKRDAANDGSGVFSIPVSPFPIFIRGASGTLPALRKALEGALVDGSCGDVLQIASKLKSDSVELAFSNPLSVPWHGRVAAGGSVSELLLPGKEKASVAAPLKTSLSTAAVSEVDVPITVEADGSEAVSKSVVFRAFASKKVSAPMTIDGDLSDWNGVPEIKLDSRAVFKKALKEDVGYPGDCEAWFRVAWDEKFLYLAVRVVDDVFRASDSVPVGLRYNFDSVQLYLDTFCDARANVEDKFDANDYNYDFYPAEDGKSAVAFLRFRPSHQYCGGLSAPSPNSVASDVRVAFKRTSDGYVYEIAIPAWNLQPMKLEEGFCVGFGLQVNDTDKDVVRKSALSDVPGGRECFRNARFFPALLLTK